MERHQSEPNIDLSTKEEQTPDMYLCPISKSLMHDPVVIVETGQVYDSNSIKRWFEAGNNTCPLTGVSLTSQSLISLPELCKCINDWAHEHGVVIDPPEMLASDKKEFGELDSLCRSLALVTAKGISVYDPEAVVQLLTRETVQETYAAMVVLRELVQHSDDKQFKKIKDLIDLETLKYLLKRESMQKPAARLLVSLKGSLDMDELTAMLPIPDTDLQIELMTRLVEQICQRHSSMDRGRILRLSVPSLWGKLRRICTFPRRCFSF